jgi:hypothetical protein
MRFRNGPISRSSARGIDQALDTGGGSLNEAEFGPIGRFPMKLGVDADKIAFGQLSAEIFEGRLLSNGSQGVVSHRGLAYRIARTNARVYYLPRTFTGPTLSGD